jgi:hypothetical protein
MTDRRWRKALTALGMGLLVVGVSVPAAGAVASTTIASWEMNEPPGSTTMLDSSGNGINGTIGSSVLTGVEVLGSTAYRWTFRKPAAPPAEPGRLVMVDDARLNAGTRDFAVTVRFRTTNSFGNMIQKGQSGSVGGYFKWEIPKGNLMCLFKGLGPKGGYFVRTVRSDPIRLNDGAWHTVRCERLPDRIVMTIDGTVTHTTFGKTGVISNNVPLTIGGKSQCDQVTITCDYFAGDIDSVLIQAS